MARKIRLPITISIDSFDPKGQAGTDSSGNRWIIKGAPVGATVQIQRQKKQKGRLLSIETLPPNSLTPKCPAFGICGGCQVQHMPLADQRTEKSNMLRRMFPSVPNFHETMGAPEEYAYRNKIELTFGTKNYTINPEETTTEGSYLGFHPRGWFSKIVPINNCAISTPQMNSVVEFIQSLELAPAWNEYSHNGTWRHIIIREGNGILVSLVTSSSITEEEIDDVASKILALPPVVSVRWIVTDALAKASYGTETKVYGEKNFSISLFQKQFQIPHDGFFQVNTKGMEVLLSCIEKACSGAHTLLDLYCGAGSIGISLSHLFQEVIGIELHEESITWARINAQQNNVEGKWYAGTVESILPTLSVPQNSLILVDPPRAGLHPKAAKFLAEQNVEKLVYVACSPASLARDAVTLQEGRWMLESLWSVDLFPQTPHVETIALFTKRAP